MKSDSITFQKPAGTQAMFHSHAVNMAKNTSSGLSLLPNLGPLPITAMCNAETKDASQAATPTHRTSATRTGTETPWTSSPGTQWIETMQQGPGISCLGLTILLGWVGAEFDTQGSS